MPESNARPWWLERCEPEPIAMLCLDQEEVDEWVWLYANVGLATSATSEARVRLVCERKGVAFTATMQAACCQAGDFR